MALTQCFRSTHTGAPTLTGESGSYTALLDAILVDGYNPQTITITRSGTTATATCTAHGFVEEQVLAISGADQADYNLSLTRITNVTANTFDFEVANSPTTPATGTITAKVAPLGFTIAYEPDTIERSYQRPAGSNGWYLNVGAGPSTNAVRLRLFETVTAGGVAVSNGTNPVPTDAQFSGGTYSWGSAAASSVSRSWTVFGNARTVYFFTLPNTTAHSGGFILTDVVGEDATSAHILLAGGAGGYTSTWMGEGSVISAAPTSNSYVWVTDSRSLSGSPARVNFFASGYQATAMGIYNNVAPISYGLPLLVTRIQEEDFGIWGRLPGFFVPVVLATDIAEGDTATGATGSAFAGRSFEFFERASHGTFAIETSDDWA